MDRIGFNQYGNLEEAREIATKVIEKYGDWQDLEMWNKFRDVGGIWNDHPAVQAALMALDRKTIQKEVDR